MNTNEEKEKRIFVVLDETGEPIHSASWEESCHEHINDAINEFQIEGAEKWRVVECAALRAESEPVYQILRLIKLQEWHWVDTEKKYYDNEELESRKRILYTAPQTEPKLHALEYQANGITYALTIEGCNEEAHAHAMRLGLTYLGHICGAVPS